MSTPSSRRLERNLCLLFSDVVGSRRLYSILGDSRALEAIKKQEAICTKAVAGHGGAVVKTQGDGVMAKFFEVSAAVEAALEFQEALADYNRDPLHGSPLNVRIGIHCGEGVSEDTDVYGQVVNIAAHIEKLGSPGSVLVSGEVYERLPAALRDGFSYHGPELFKGVERIVELWRTGFVLDGTSGTRRMDVYDGWSLDSCAHAPAFRVRASAEGPQAGGAGLQAGGAGRPPTEIVVREKLVTIGKSNECDLRFANDGFLSRVHAILAVVGDILWIFDNDSKAGILLEDPKLAPGRALVVFRRGPLLHGQTAVLSTVRLTAEPLPK